MPLNKKYTYRVSWSEEDAEFVGLCAEFPSLSWLGASHEAALKGIMKVVREVVVDMQDNGESPPVPIASREYSGVFKLRIPPPLHRALVIEAAESNVSLNRLVNAKLAT
jgi:predicted HicB family RNase H-like nuclease